MATPTINADYWPIVTTTWPASVSEAELGTYLDGMTRIFELASPWVHIIDGRRGMASTVSPRHRATIIAYWNALSPERVATVKGEAYVLESAVQRGIITALGWMFPPPWERRMFASLAEAERWAAGRLAPWTDPVRSWRERYAEAVRENGEAALRRAAGGRRR